MVFVVRCWLFVACWLFVVRFVGCCVLRRVLSAVKCLLCVVC